MAPGERVVEDGLGRRRIVGDRARDEVGPDHLPQALAADAERLVDLVGPVEVEEVEEVGNEPGRMIGAVVAPEAAHRVLERLRRIGVGLGPHEAEHLAVEDEGLGREADHHVDDLGQPGR